MIKFKNQKLLTRALTHRSALNEKKGLEISNERLEFLGDAVLELVISDYLYKKHPRKAEGNLTHLRAQIVQTKTLAAAAAKLNLGKKLILSKGEKIAQGHKNPHLLADVFEAIIGAVYLDQGLTKATQFIKTNLLKDIDSFLKQAQVDDYKSKFQEVSQRKFKIAPVYKVIKASGPDHSKKFTVKVTVNQKKMGQGTGKSKQDAEQKAAKAALEKNKHL